MLATLVYLTVDEVNLLDGLTAEVDGLLEVGDDANAVADEDFLSCPVTEQIKTSSRHWDIGQLLFFT